ncbi:hypothetical protein VPH35_040039 [Triticum aestivum]
MASHPPPLAPEHPIPPAPTTISALDDDQLREIFLRLPDLPSLASAAFTCRTFLGAVRSSCAFRRSFRAHHAPPLLALFLTHYMRTVPTFPASHPPTAARFSPLRDDDASEWGVDFSDPSIAYDEGFIALQHRSTKQEVYYNPQTMVLFLHPQEHHDMPDGTTLEFHTLSLGEHQRLPRVVSVRHDYSRPWARVAVFSPDTMEGQIFPETAALLPEGFRRTTRTLVDGFICWQCESVGGASLSEYILVLNTDTFQFSLIDVPPPLRVAYTEFRMGQTKNGRLCIVNEKEYTLSIWILTDSDDGVQRFVLHNTFLLHSSFMSAAYDGFHWFCVPSISPWKNSMDQFKSPEWFMSFSLETAVLNQHFKNREQLPCPVHPYLAWPPLVCSMEDSESEVTGDGLGDVGPESTEKASSAPITALRSFKEALIKDGEVNVAEIEAFLLCIDVDDENSLVRRITALDELLTTVRDRVLRVADLENEFYEQKTESWWQMCKGKLWRTFFGR